MNREPAMPTEDQLREIREHNIQAAKLAAESNVQLHVADTFLRNQRKQNGRPLYGDEP